VLPKKIATSIRELAEDKKAEDLIILDVKKQSSFAHYFVITHGNNERHVNAIAENIMSEMKKKGEPVWQAEGVRESKWVLLDFGSVVVHIFCKELREFYALERLWGDAKRI
jgi:ribosome-associated protein